MVCCSDEARASPAALPFFVTLVLSLDHTTRFDRGIAFDRFVNFP
jgi:hypothetical protein